MKTKEILCIIPIILLLLIPNIVKGVEGDTELETPTQEETKLEENEKQAVWTDVSNLKLEVINNSSYGKVSYSLKVSGATEIKDHMYYTFITNSATEPELIIDESNNRVEYENVQIPGIYPVGSYNMDKHIEKNGDIYYWLLEQQKDSETNQYIHKFIVHGRKIERPKQLELGKRIEVGFYKDYTYVNLLVVKHTNTERKIKIKVGQVTDNSILLAIKNNESNALNKLLSYAKTEKSIYSETFAAQTQYDGVITSNQLIDNAYYYIYAELEDENGTYYPVEDVGLVQADIRSDGEFVLSKNIDWEMISSGEKTPEKTDNEKPEKDQTVAQGKIPQTGEMYTVLGIVVAFIAVTLVSAYKYNKYKGIK